MSTAVITAPIPEASPQFPARIAGLFYLLTILLGAAVLLVHGRLNFAIDLIAGACFIAVPLLFYDLFKSVSRNLAFLAAFCGLLQIKFGGLNWHGVDIGMVSHGFYCLLIGFLIFRSTFLPRILGLLMTVAGLGWLTSVVPPLASFLSPYNLAPGILGEAALTLWLLVFGVNAHGWQEQSAATATAIN